VNVKANKNLRDCFTFVKVIKNKSGPFRLKHYGLYSAPY